MTSPKLHHIWFS